MSKQKEEEEENKVPEYDEWFKVEFMVKKPKKLQIEALAHDIKTDIDVELGHDFDYKELIIKGLTKQQAYADNNNTIPLMPVYVWQPIYIERQGKTIFDETGEKIDEMLREQREEEKQE